MFKTLGVRNTLLFVKTPTSVENLIYSPPGSSVHPVFITDEQIESLQCYHFSQCDCPQKIWLSRSGLKDGSYGKIDNEPFIEEELVKLGYTIIHPQKLSLYEQTRLVSSSGIVAGFDGSQFFTVLFAKDIYSKIFVFNRRKAIPDTIPYVFERKNIDFSLHSFDLEHIKGSGAGSIFHHKEPQKVIDILNI